MNTKEKLHPAQVTILSTLRHVTRARYSELMRPTQLEGDRFKYHLLTMVKRGYIQKDTEGHYVLTPEGKEFANRLNEQTGYELAQPKASLLLVARSRRDGQVVYLAHRRLREPFYEFWGIGSAPLLRGVSIREAAAREFAKQTGLVADFEVVGMQRVIDTSPSGTIFEDKLFSLLLADVPDCPATHAWHGGESVWLTKTELLHKTPLFPTTLRTLEMIENGVTFSEDNCTYTTDQY